MPERIEIRIDGRSVLVKAGTSVAVALLDAGAAAQPVCGMGVCFRCCVEIDGHPHRRGCLVRCAPGMEIQSRG